MNDAPNDSGNRFPALPQPLTIRERLVLIGEQILLIAPVLQVQLWSTASRRRAEEANLPRLRSEYLKSLPKRFDLEREITALKIQKSRTPHMPLSEMREKAAKRELCLADVETLIEQLDAIMCTEEKLKINLTAKDQTVADIVRTERAIENLKRDTEIIDGLFHYLRSSWLEEPTAHFGNVVCPNRMKEARLAHEYDRLRRILEGCRGASPTAAAASFQYLTTSWIRFSSAEQGQIDAYIKQFGENGEQAATVAALRFIKEETAAVGHQQSRPLVPVLEVETDVRNGVVIKKDLRPVLRSIGDPSPLLTTNSRSGHERLDNRPSP